MAGYELKKIWMKRHGLIWLLLIVCIQIVASFTRYDAAYLNFDMESEKAYFLQYVQAYAGMNAEQTYSAVQKEFIHLQQGKPSRDRQNVIYSGKRHCYEKHICRRNRTDRCGGRF